MVLGDPFLSNESTARLWNHLVRVQYGLFNLIHCHHKPTPFENVELVFRMTREVDGAHFALRLLLVPIRPFLRPLGLLWLCTWIECLKQSWCVAGEDLLAGIIVTQRLRFVNAAGIYVRALA